jgi:integrase
MYATKFQTGRAYDFNQAINDLRPIAKADLALKVETREYTDPLALIGSIENTAYRLGARLQYEGGARIREAGLIARGQLLGIRQDKVTCRDVGVVFLNSTGTKGGRAREMQISLESYLELSRIITEAGCYRIDDHDAYRRALRKASLGTHQSYNGSHGLRYCFAQRRYLECRAQGMGEIEAKLQVSLDMGHGRPNITEWYLRALDVGR